MRAQECCDPSIGTEVLVDAGFRSVFHDAEVHQVRVARLHPGEIHEPIKAFNVHT